MSESLEIPVTYGNQTFNITIKYNRESKKLVLFVSLVDDILRFLESDKQPENLILLTRTKNGLLPIYRENYEIIEKTLNVVVDFDGSIMSSMVIAFEKSYLIHPHLESNIFPIVSLFSVLNDSLLTIMKHAKGGESKEFDHIDALTNREAELYLDSYFAYYNLSPSERKSIYNGNYFGVKRDDKANDAETVYNSDPYLDTALFNAMRGGNVENFEKQRKKFKMTSLLLMPREVYQCFIKKHQTWEPEKIWKDALAQFISYDYFGIPEDPDERMAYFASHDLGFLDHECIRDIYRAALSILRQTQEGDVLVVFGNSPFFVGRVLKFLLSREIDTKRVLIEFPFSGTPNGMRDSRFNPKDIVTPARLEHLQKRLRRAGLSSENPSLLKGKTYFIDVVGSGAGFAYVAEEIFRDFYHAKLSTPDLLLLTMNKLNINRNMGRNHLIARENPDSMGHTILYFPTVENVHFVTLAKEAYVKSHMRLDMLSDNGMRGYPEYNASYWQEEYDYLLTPSYSNAMLILLEYFDQNILSLFLLDKHKEDNQQTNFKSCQTCGKGGNLFIETSEPYGIYCSKSCQ